MVSGSHDNTLKIWDLATGKQLASVNLDADITCCAITPNGQTIVVGDVSGGVHFLRLEILKHAEKQLALEIEQINTAISLNNSAKYLKTKGDYESAEPHYRHALAICEKVLGVEHSKTMTFRNNLAVLSTEAQVLLHFGVQSFRFGRDQFNYCQI